MKLIVLGCVLLFFLCNATGGKITSQEDFKLAIAGDSDFCLIESADKYEYWECVYSPISWIKSRKEQRVVAQVGDRKFSKYTKKIFSSRGFFTACGSGFCGYYIVAVKKDKTISVINTRSLFEAFLGQIDNVEEAKLAIRNNGYILPPDGQYVAKYWQLADGYKFDLFDFGFPTDVINPAFKLKLKSISVKVDRLGRVTRL